MQPLAAGRQPLTGQGAQPVPAADLPRPTAGVRVVETTLQQRPQPAPAAAAPAVVPTTAPPPTRGLSVRGREGAAPSAVPAPAAAPNAAPAVPAAANPPANAAAPAPADKPENSGDDASARFSLLELD